MAKKERTTADLINVLFDELDALCKGTSTPQQAGAKAKIANSIISVKRLEADIARFVADARANGSEQHGVSVRLAS